MKQRIEIKKYVLTSDPELTFYRVEVSDIKGVWCETFGSKDLLRAFLRGIKAGASIYIGTYVPEPEIPRRAIRIPFVVKDDESA